MFEKVLTANLCTILCGWIAFGTKRPEVQILSLRPKQEAGSVSYPLSVLLGVRRDAEPLTRRKARHRVRRWEKRAISAEHSAGPRFQILSLRPRKVPETLSFRDFFYLFQRRQKSGLTTYLTRDRISLGFGGGRTFSGRMNPQFALPLFFVFAAQFLRWPLIVYFPYRLCQHSSSLWA